MLYRLITLLMLFPFYLFAAPFYDPGPEVLKLDKVEGHSLVDVTSVVEDQAGFVWLGSSAEGLLRYDGYTLKIFTKADGLVDNSVMRLLVDKQGYIWVATMGGISRFDPRTERFTNFTHDPEKGDSLSANMVVSIKQGKGDSLWIATAKGVNRLNTKSLKVDRFAPLSMPEALVVSVFEDRQNRLWVSTLRQGLWRYDPASGQTRHFVSAPEKPSAPDLSFVGDIYQSQDGNLWFGARNELLRYVDASDSFQRYPLRKADSECCRYGIRISHIIEDASHRLWLTSLGNGIMRLDSPNALPITLNLHDYPDEGSFADAVQTRSGMLIFATNAALLTLAPQALNVHHQVVSSPGSFISRVFADGDDFWVGINQDLYVMHKSRDAWQPVARDLGQVEDIFKTSSGAIAVAVKGKGIFTYDSLSKTLAPHPVNPMLQATTGRLEVTQVIEDKQGNMILLVPAPRGPSKDEIYRYDANSKTLMRLIEAQGITDILRVQDKLLMSSYEGGLMIVDLQGNAETETIGDTNTLGIVIDLFQDSQSRIWLGTMNAGLVRLDLKRKTLDYFGDNVNMPNKSIASIIEDSKGALWLGSVKELIRFDPQSHSVRLYGEHQGLRMSRFRKNQSARTSNGTVWLAMEDKLLSFDPKSLSQSVVDHQVLLTDFRLKNRSVKPQSDGQGALLRQSIESTQALTLSYEDNLFSLSFASDDYSVPENTHYAYRLVGLNDNWYETKGYERTATFTSLPPGSYDFQVKTTRSDGRWSDQYRSLKITVTPPWYLTTQAYIAYIVLFVLSLYGFIRSRTQRLVKQAKLLEQTVAQRTEELQTSRDEVTRLLGQKEQTFADISHEIKTPLTLILSPLEAILSGEGRKRLPQDIGSKLDMMRRNGSRLLRLVEYILELSRLDTSIRQQQQQYSLKQTLSLLLGSFEPLLKEKSLTLSCDEYDDVTLVMNVDSLEMILTNLLSNAVKYTPKGGHIHIGISRQGNRVTVSIKDDGIGMTPAQQQQVFERFTRARENHGEHIPGTGLGLALVKQLVEHHQGSIEVTSEPDRGSTFSITLPCGEGLQDAVSPAVSAEYNLSGEVEALSATPFVPTVTLDEQAQDKQSKPTILLIDDSADMLRLLTDSLSSNYHCLQAMDGASGLAIATENIPDVIICDVMMPGMSGFEVAKALKLDELTCHIPVVLLTAKGDVESRMEGWKQEIDDYLDKPFHPQELLLRLDSLLSIRHILQKRHLQDYGAAPTQRMPDPVMSDKDRQFIERLRQILLENYADSDFNRDQCATLMGISERQLSRKLSALLDESFPELLRDLRLEQAVARMTSGKQISQISDEVGFAALAYFGKCFKAKYGKTPKQYQSEVIH